MVTEERICILFVFCFKNCTVSTVRVKKNGVVSKKSGSIYPFICIRTFKATVWKIIVNNRILRMAGDIFIRWIIEFAVCLTVNLFRSVPVWTWLLFEDDKFSSWFNFYKTFQYLTKFTKIKLFLFHFQR